MLPEDQHNADTTDAILSLIESSTEKFTDTTKNMDNNNKLPNDDDDTAVVAVD